MADDKGAPAQADSDNFVFVDSGPPPDMKQRELIFDSFKKIVGQTKGRQKGRGPRVGNNRGTYVFSWGAGYHGQLGRKFQRGVKKYSAVPTPIDCNVVVRQISCGGLHTAWVTDHGDVFSWGDGRKGQLGHPNDPSMIQTPRIVDALSVVHVVQVACGAQHTVCLTDKGNMYSWGWNKFGQLGHGDRQTVKTPKLISGEHAQRISQIACGNKHSMAINQSGVAVSWGCGEHGQTGQPRPPGQLPTAEQDKLRPTVIDELQDQFISMIDCGSIHSCFITNLGELYLCGFGEHFYPNETQHFVYKPKLIEMQETIKQVACGQSHNVVLTKGGNVFTWGSGEYGQLGHGIKGNSSVPRMVLEGKDVQQVAAGRYHSFALTRGGALYSWGCGENGQLGLDSDDNVSLPAVVTHILGAVVGQIACGEHHTAVLTSAPWTKLSADCQEWLLAAKTEHEQQKAILKKTHRGLLRTDLAKVKAEMRKWQTNHDKKKMEQLFEQNQELEMDIASIQYADQIQKELNEKTATMKLPAVQNDQEQAPEAEEANKDQTVRLPKVHQKKVHTTKAATARSTNTPYKRASSAEAGAAGIRQQAPLTRTAFLKDTAQMVKRMKATVQEKGEATNQKEHQRMVRLVFALRKDYDSLKNNSRNLSKEVEGLKKEQKLLQKSNQLSKDEFSLCSEQLKGLEMQLNTVTIKIAETSENRKNYELNIAHLKEEDFENFNQLKALRKQNQDNNNFFKKMEELKSQAVEEKEKAESELEEFSKEINGYQKFVGSQLQQFESILNIIRSQNEKREKAKYHRQEKTRSKIAQRIDKLQQEAEAAEKEAGGLTARLTTLDLKLRHFEDSFQKITAATGLTNPDAIINKFVFKGEIKNQLEDETESKMQQIEELTKEQGDLEETLKKAKASFVNDSWGDVKQLQEGNRQSNFQSGVKSEKMAKTQQRLIFAQEGMASLLNAIEQTQDVESTDANAGASSLWSEDQASSVFKKISDMVVVLLDVERDRNARLQEEDAKKRQVEEEEKKKLEEEHKFSNMPFNHSNLAAIQDTAAAAAEVE